jgi:nitrate reductase gamma subunit
MAEAPRGFQLHGLAAMFLFALWPFTRLGPGLLRRVHDRR